MNQLLQIVLRMWRKMHIQWKGAGAPLKKQDSGNSGKRILIIVPHDKSWWALHVVQQFVSTLRQLMGHGGSPSIDIVPVQSSVEVLQSLLLSLTASPCYDLVITVGSWISREVRDFFDSVAKPTPQIFCGVIDPAGIGVVDTLEVPGRPVSGIAALSFDFELQIEMLLAILPQLKTLIMVYGADSGNDMVSGLVARNLGHFSAICSEKGIRLVHTPIVDMGAIEDVIQRLALEPGSGVVCSLNDLLVSAQMETLIALCVRLQIPLCTSELSSVYHGAALGFGEHGGVYGLYAASMAYEVLAQGRDIATVPVVIPPIHQSMRYNYDALIAQGVVISPAMKHLLNMVSVFFNAKQ
jgi:ABC-type uncharacterized transport system substrate-binding protein